MSKFKFTYRRNSGGKPVFAGAQGCVFLPSLKCKHRKRNMNDGNVSKLGFKESSEFEMREYEKIAPFIKKIKNYEKYFSIRATSCEPDALSSRDLIGFDDVCINFKNDGITESNVNKNLHKLRAINMPNLGKDLKVWMDTVPLDAGRIRMLNDHISELLVHAVVPMNQQGIMHNDLKSENIMMDNNENNVRIIDWGLAGITKPHQIIPDRYFMSNPVTFNRPFSTMVVSPEVDELYHKYISQSQVPPEKFTPQHLTPFVSEIYKEYREQDQSSHEYFTYIFESIFNLNTQNANVLFNSAVEKYNAEVLHHFTDPVRHKFMMDEYFDKVYRYNTDVWGTMSVFYSMFMLPRDRFIMTDSVYYDMLQRYRNIFGTMVFVNGHKRMNVQNIVKELQQITNAVSNKFNKFNKSKFNKFNNSKSNKFNKSKSNKSNKFNKFNKSNKFNKFNKSIKKMVRFNIDDTHNKPQNHNYRIPTPHPLKEMN